MARAVTLLSPAPPGLQEATTKSTTVWQSNLESLFQNAKDRFPDVVWDLTAEGDEGGEHTEEVWGHKAIVYARAPPSFQNRYFSFSSSTSHPYSPSPNGGASALSLSLGLDGVSRSSSPRSGSPAPSTMPGTLTRLPTSINPILFSNELEYLYTGKGFGEAFEFLFDTSETREEGDGEEQRIDKLRKDLVFMWRSRLYSDIRIALTGNFSSANHEDTTAIFSSHRFVLVSRAPYFRDALLSWGSTSNSKQGTPVTVTLPSPPFTPASLHFTLGFIYTGTLIFSHRSYDLETAFHIMRSASYLSLDTLYDEIQARIVQEMMHGLFHAFLEFSEYESVTNGKWGTGGCRCRQCARRAPRILEFALSEDVKNPHLERGARRALVGLYGEGWCTSEFAGMEQKYRDSILKGLAKRTTPVNIFGLLFATHHALAKISNVIDSWVDVVREAILAARKTIDEVLVAQSEECFQQEEWLEIMESDGVGFQDAERVEWIMDSVKRGLSEKYAAIVYQTLVSSILLRPHPTDSDAPMLSSTSHIRVQVEQARVDILHWIRRRWVGIRSEGGFDSLEGWSVKEISDDTGVSVEDLLTPATSPTRKVTPTRNSITKPGAAVVKSDADNDAASMASLRATVLSRNMNSRTTTPTRREPAAPVSSASSVRSVARSTVSTVSRAAASGPRPDSKLTPSVPAKKPSSIISTRRGVTPRPSRPTSSASSVRSHASTIRHNGAGPSTLRAPSTISRSTSRASNMSDSSTTFKTANTEMLSTRSRKSSAASVMSTASTKTTGTTRSRRPSTSSIASTLSTAAKASPTAKAKRAPPIPPIDPTKLTPVKKRTPSLASVRSTTSLASTAASAAKTVLKRPEQKLAIPLRKAPSGTSTIALNKGKGRASTIVSDSRHSTISSSSTSTLKRKTSSDTITKKKAISKPAAVPIDNPRGAMLEIGIPCIISSKRKRFKAFARYIGEVEGETGPWVGVEVPVGESWAGESLEGRQWNDGSWGGIRYFEIGNTGSEWEYGDTDRATRRRRVDYGINNKKREGEPQLNIDYRAKRFRTSSPAPSDVSTAESRGLFVRPQQVLYVVDAVGDL